MKMKGGRTGEKGSAKGLATGGRGGEWRVKEMDKWRRQGSRSDVEYWE